MEKTATIFDIGRFRNEDGPGIRTIIFFKGCPLKCVWCSNPFGLSKVPQLAVNRERCTGCARCVTACPEVNAIADGKVAVDFSKCKTCGNCVFPCPADTRMISGRQYSARELFQEAYKDIVFYRKNRGGVTFSGGEVLMQHEVAAEALRMCRKNYLSTCIETSAYAPWEHLRHVAQYCSYVFVDLKLMDNAKHREYVGVPNELILKNIQKLCEFAAGRGIKVIVRKPVIPGYNDCEDEAVAAALFVSGLDGSPELNILPYHNLGEAKYKMIGQEYLLEEQKMLAHSDPRLVQIQELSRQYAPHNRISIGGDAIDLSSIQ